MSYAVSITQDGTRLETAGKYVDQDIVVGMSDSIKKGAQTYTPTTADQTIPAGKYLSGAQTIKGDANLVAGNIRSGKSIFGVAGSLTPGITPSGTKNITENGTYDVAEFANAAVNVTKGDNWKCFDATIVSAVPAWGNNYIIIAQDADVASHYDDLSARLFMTYKGEGYPESASYNMVLSANANVPLYSTGSADYYAVNMRMSSSGKSSTIYSALQMSTDKSQTSSRYGLWVDSNGNIGLMTLGLAPGNYSIFFTW